MVKVLPHSASWSLVDTRWCIISSQADTTIDAFYAIVPVRTPACKTKIPVSLYSKTGYLYVLPKLSWFRFCSVTSTSFQKNQVLLKTFLRRYYYPVHHVYSQMLLRCHFLWSIPGYLCFPQNHRVQNLSFVSIQPKFKSSLPLLILSDSAISLVLPGDVINLPKTDTTIDVFMS